MNDKVRALYNWLEKQNLLTQAVLVFSIILLVLSAYILVIFTGGIRNGFEHFMYLPILSAGVIFGVYGGVLTGLIGGVLLGPYLPFDLYEVEVPQSDIWYLQLLFFMSIGAITGITRQSLFAYVAHFNWSCKHDQSTNLSNLASLEEALLNTEIKTDLSVNSKYFIILSLTNSREIEINYNPSSLEGVLVEIANRFEKITNSIVYRASSDYLCAIVCEDESRDIERILSELESSNLENIVLKDNHIHGDILIWTAALRNENKSAEYYLQKANIELLKNGSRGYLNNSHEIELENSLYLEHKDLIGYVKSALDCNQIYLQYQPRIELSTGRIVQAEALMRWKHPEFGNISPDRFIPRVERSTLIDRVTEFVLDRSLMQVAKWDKENACLNISVNISARNLMHPDFLHVIKALLDKHELQGNKLELELTETSLMHNISRSIQILSEIVKLGVVVSIDDFGTGYSSLQYLQMLPVSIIKIDKSFMADLATCKSARNIVDSTLYLAKKVGMKVVAEGVENGETLRLLREIGCEYAQGFYISRPIGPSVLKKLYSKNNGYLNFKN